MIWMKFDSIARPPTLDMGENIFPFSVFMFQIIYAYQSSLTLVIVYRESDNLDEDGGGGSNSNGKRQLKLSNVGFFSTSKRRSEEVESSGKGRCRFFQARKLEHLTNF